MILCVENGMSWNKWEQHFDLLRLWLASVFANLKGDSPRGQAIPCSGIAVRTPADTL